MIAPTEPITENEINPPPIPVKKTGVRLVFAACALLLLAMALFAILLIYSSIYLSLGLVFATIPIAIALAIPAALVVVGRREIVIFALLLSICLTAPILVARWDLWRSDLQLFLLLLSVVILIASFVRLLLCWMDRSFVMSIILLLALVWMTFPIWAARLMPGHANDQWLIVLLNIHPTIGLNAAYLSLGEWAHQRIAYRWLTNLGQDVSYLMPFGQALYSILFHSFLSIMFFIIPIKPRPRI